MLTQPRHDFVRSSMHQTSRQGLVIVESWLSPGWWDRASGQDRYRTGELDPSQQVVPVRACARGNCWGDEPGDKVQPMGQGHRQARIIQDVTQGHYLMIREDSQALWALRGRSLLCRLRSCSAWCFPRRTGLDALTGLPGAPRDGEGPRQFAADCLNCWALISIIQINKGLTESLRVRVLRWDRDKGLGG